MSIQHVGEILDHHAATGSERLILISIANHTDENWEAYPSQACIAHETGLHDKTVKDSIKRMVEKGWLHRETNAAPDERMRADRRPNLYKILWPEEALKPSWREVRGSRGESSTTPAGEPTGVVISPDGGSDLSARGESETTPNHQLNHQVEPSGKTLSSPTASDDADQEEDEPFDPIPVPPEVTELCNYLAAKLEVHYGAMPNITKKWYKDMELLLRLGPLGWKDAPPEPAKVMNLIDWIFAQEPRNGFTWADNIRSPGKLRQQYVRLRKEALDNYRQGGNSAPPSKVDRSMAALEALQQELGDEDEG